MKIREFSQLIRHQPGDGHPIAALVFVTGLPAFNVRRAVQDFTHHLAQASGARIWMDLVAHADFE